MDNSVNPNVYQIPVHEVSGVGSRKALDLNAIGIHSVGDLIEYFPFRYEDYRIRDLTQVQDGEKVTVQGEILSEPSVHMFGKNKSRMVCKVMIDRFLISAVWFNRHFLKERMVLGQEIVLTGKWEQHRRQITVSESEFPGKGTSQAGSIQPVYSVSGSVSQKWMRKTIQQALLRYEAMIAEILPDALIFKRMLMPRKQAIQTIHQPGHVSDGGEARRRLVYEELFLFQLKLLAYRVVTRDRADGVAQPIDMEAVRAFVHALPFQLTVSQKQVTAELLRDMRSSHSMNRLLQGDVGSGKTIIAAIGLFATVTAGYQGALMVPTEILAEQHTRTLSQLFEPYGIQVEMLAGGLGGRQQRDVRAALQSGLTSIVVGTNSLIQESVNFKQLGLVVTDEQHRFGVQQRSVLRRKGMNPDVLTMTATPIPRTLAITAFGDMDVSSLTEMPRGRMPVKTYAVKHSLFKRVLAFIEKALTDGRQAFIICPLIEESEKLDVQNAIDLHAELQQYFSEHSVGLLHGRLTAAEKDQVMRNFHANELQLLVSTTVIEVGIDVPNATIMIVYDADRFGLSQLHQLRGRVGRGEYQSYCILIADPKSEVGRLRMQAMTETTDGFEIARRDLELRGPGEFFGMKQSGMPEFRLADIMADFAVMEAARDDAAELLARSDFWTGIEYLPLRNYLQQEQILDNVVLD